MTRTQLHTVTLATSVNSDTATITILTHGLGGDARDWSNNFNGTKGSRTAFAYDSDSIIEKIRNTIPSGIILYRAKTYSANSFLLYSEYSNIEVTRITDFSQHNVIVMDTYTWIEMEQAYEYLHYVMDKISYDFFSVMGCLPRINLIGHSMGGLLNMQYAIVHPKNVVSLVSLGTPYNGSWYDNWFVSLLGIKDFQNQPCLTDTCNHSYYFCNLIARNNTWNNVFAQNMHIKFHTLSGETSLDIMNHIVWDNKYLEDYIGTGAAIGIRAAYIISPIVIAGGLYALPGDVCVDTDSQKAARYYGAINYNKNFKTSNSNVNKRSHDYFPVPHNLEAYDSDMHDYILKNVTFGVPFSTNNVGNTITGYNVSLSGSISVPSQINGIAITAIGNLAFANSSLSILSIPSSMSIYDLSAFHNCGSLTSVTIPWESGMANRATCPHTVKNTYIATQNYHWNKCTACYMTFREGHTITNGYFNCNCGYTIYCTIRNGTITTSKHTGNCNDCGISVSERHRYIPNGYTFICMNCGRVSKPNEPIEIWSKPRTVTDNDSIYSDECCEQH